MRIGTRVFIVLVLVSVAWQTLTAQEATQPAETTPEVVILTPSLTPSATPTATPSLTPTPTATATATSEVTVEVTEDTSPTAEVTAEPTTTDAPELTDEPHATSELTTEVTDDTTPIESDTPTLTETPTATFTASPTQTPSPILDFRLMPTATVGIPMVYITGTVHYQNRLPNHSGIKVYIANGDWVLLSLAVTDANGAYTVAVPSDTFFWLVAEGPLHKSYQLGVWPGDTLPTLITLAGGDLNADGCIGALDIQVLTAYYDQSGSTNSDITADGITDVSDLAILTGNFNTECELSLIQSPTPTLTPELPTLPADPPSAEVTAEATPELTPEP